MTFHFPAIVVRLGFPFALIAICISSMQSLGAPNASRAERVSFDESIRPLFAKHCVACHGGVKQASGVSFIYREQALAEGDSGTPAIVPGDVSASYLVERIVDTDPEYRMPPAEHGAGLSDQEIATVKQWIAEGASWEESWSFAAPTKHELPANKKQWGTTRIDPFVLHGMESQGLEPSPQASKSEWLRRVTLDLTGLPATADERAAFLSNQSSDAYAQVVDRLLASPRYGERWASVWLDLARYSDTMGFERDPHRDIWPYRDWLITALNDDLPYDQFLIKQLAGDLLPDATLDDRVAAAFHSNSQTNTEGGTDDEEFRTAAVLDRVNTTWQVFGGLTFGCSQCHSHPYDPIRNEEYYKFVAVFNSTRDYDLDEETPRLQLPRDKQAWQRANQLDRRISKLKRQRHDLLLPLAEEAGAWHSLTIGDAKSTGQTKLVSRNDPDGAGPEFVTTGTVTSRSVFTLVADLPAETKQLTALRIDSLPLDTEQALRTPESGFVVTRLRAWLELPGESEPREVFFRLSMCDEPEPILQPGDCFNDNNNGWGVFPKIDRPRWAVFVLEQPVDIVPGSKLKIQLKHNRSATGQIAQVVNRGRLAVSGDARWTSLVDSDQAQELEQSLAEAVDERQAIKCISIPSIQQLDVSLQRHTYIFERGNWLNKGERVAPGVPQVFPRIAKGQQVDRLAVAQWFASPTHPLTARVQVNRLWEQLFGLGIVETPGDFGTSGVRPSHPQLLDDLAVRFQTDMNWSAKQLLREMVLSATYRQQSFVSDELLKRDPRNRLLARGPRQRLTAEMVRDQALVLSGKFADKMYGPPVMPPQPDGVWQSVYSGAKWVTAEGDNRYRRAVYTYWKRTSPYPSLTMFDVPSREVCSIRRIATNTPLQPLVTMNDPVFIECAQAFANRMAGEGSGDPTEQIAWALEQATGDSPRTAAVQALRALYDDALKHFRADDAEMIALGPTAGAYARTLVASAVLNLDDVLTR